MSGLPPASGPPRVIAVGLRSADSVAKVAAALLWNSNLKETNRDVRTFGSVLRVRVKT
jgi:hypothetical protein